MTSQPGQRSRQMLHGAQLHVPNGCHGNSSNQTPSPADARSSPETERVSQRGPSAGGAGGGGRRGRIWCRRRPIVARRRRPAGGPDATVAQLCRRLKNAGGSGPVIAEQRAVERRAAVCGRCWTPRRPLTAALTTVDDSERQRTTADGRLCAVTHC